MKRTMMILIAGFTLIIAASAWAQTLGDETTTLGTTEKTQTTATTSTTETTPITETASGRVTMSTGTMLTIVTDTDTQMSFSIGDQSKLPVGLQPDQMVHVVYERQADGTLRVVNVMPVSSEHQTPMSTGGVSDETLPQTGSMLPILGVAGIVAITAGLVMRTFSRRRQGNA